MAALKEADRLFPLRFYFLAATAQNCTECVVVNQGAHPVLDAVLLLLHVADHTREKLVPLRPLVKGHVEYSEYSQINRRQSSDLSNEHRQRNVDPGVLEFLRC